MGGVSAAVSKTCASPIEVIKLRLQNVGAMIKSGALDKPYTGIGDCGKRIIAEEGVIGFYKGLMACYVKVIPSVSMAFAVNNYCKKKLGVITKI